MSKTMQTHHEICGPQWQVLTYVTLHPTTLPLIRLIDSHDNETNLFCAGLKICKTKFNYLKVKTSTPTSSIPA